VEVTLSGGAEPWSAEQLLYTAGEVNEIMGLEAAEAKAGNAQEDACMGESQHRGGRRRKGVRGPKLDQRQSYWARRGAVLKVGLLRRCRDG